jgi:hypothetical protein
MSTPPNPIQPKTVECPKTKKRDVVKGKAKYVPKQAHEKDR